MDTRAKLHYNIKKSIINDIEKTLNFYELFSKNNELFHFELSDTQVLGELLHIDNRISYTLIGH